MRTIGSLNNEAHARQFGDVLVANGVHNQIDPESDGTWSVWVHDDDQLALAQTLFREFQADPNSAEFREATSGAARTRQAQADDLASYRKRVRTRRSVFPKFGGHGVGGMTYAFIVISIAMAIFSKLGSDQEFLRPWYIADPMVGGEFLADVRKGEVWRLLTPIFIHFGRPFPLHLIFNMIWLYQLGCMIEAHQGTLRLTALVVIVGVVSNFAQYYVTHYPFFGGMSGVNYGLAGYIWMRGKYDHRSGLYLDPQSITILLAWMVFCFTGWLGPVANTAHVVGLLVGVAWGRLSAFFAARRPES